PTDRRARLDRHLLRLEEVVADRDRHRLARLRRRSGGTRGGRRDGGQSAREQSQRGQRRCQLPPAALHRRAALFFVVFVVFVDRFLVAGTFFAAAFFRVVTSDAVAFGAWKRSASSTSVRT